ncbi:MAG: hypothetical protein AAGA27_03320, partial [Pseudomonadota bacterium]
MLSNDYIQSDSCPTDGSCAVHVMIKLICRHDKSHRHIYSRDLILSSLNSRQAAIHTRQFIFDYLNHPQRKMLKEFYLFLTEENDLNKIKNYNHFLPAPSFLFFILWAQDSMYITFRLTIVHLNPNNTVKYRHRLSFTSHFPLTKEICIFFKNEHYSLSIQDPYFKSRSYLSKNNSSTETFVILLAKALSQTSNKLCLDLIKKLAELKKNTQKPIFYPNNNNIFKQDNNKTPNTYKTTNYNLPYTINQNRINNNNNDPGLINKSLNTNKNHAESWSIVKSEIIHEYLNADQNNTFTNRLGLLRLLYDLAIENDATNKKYNFQVKSNAHQKAINNIFFYLKNKSCINSY